VNPFEEILADSAITVAVNLKRQPYDIYIGRSNSFYNLSDSLWRNPFVEGRDGTRAEVIEKYRAYLMKRPDLLKLIPTLRGKRLGCYCKPKACHGDVLVELANADRDW